MPGRPTVKLDTHAAKGIFLGYTATTNNIYYMDIHTCKVKISTHVVFDEAGYTIPPSERTLIQQHLHSHSGDMQLDDTTSSLNSNDTDWLPSILHVQKLIPHATWPMRATEEAVGYDLYSAATIIIPPHHIISVPMGLVMQPPDGTYFQILPCSGLIK